MNKPYGNDPVYCSVTAFYALSLTQFHMDIHSHLSHEIMYVTGGSCQILCQEDSFSLTSGHFIFLNSHTPHKLIVSGKPCSILNLEFEWNSSSGSIDISALAVNSPQSLQFMERQTPYICSTDYGNLGYALKDLIAQLHANPVPSDYLVNLLFQRMILELFASCRHKKNTANLHYIRKACAYIEENICEPLKVSQIAAHTGISKSYLQLLFPQVLQCTVTVYINQKRLEQAVFLLTNSSMSITDIAFSAGYNSRQHFGLTFEKHYAISPSKYRQLYSRVRPVDTDKYQYLLQQETTLRQTLK